MQDDTVVWQIINHSFCSFKASVAKERTFCQNPYNVTGLCLRSACPLANSRYATIKEEDGVCYLYMKTIERAHTPKNLWEKIKLPANYTKALELISKELEYFPKYLVHRNKQRLTKIHQMIIRMRKLKLTAKPIIVPINTRNEQREKGRERKALQAAELEKSIEIELLERLRQVSTESEIYNYPERVFNAAIGKVSKSAEEVLEEQEAAAEEEEEEEGEYEEEDEDEEHAVEYVEDFQPSDDEEEEDIEDSSPLTKEEMMELYKKVEAKRNKRKSDGKAGANKKGRVQIEYEYEDEEDETSKLTKAATLYNSSSSNRANKNAADYNF